MGIEHAMMNKTYSTKDGAQLVVFGLCQELADRHDEAAELLVTVVKDVLSSNALEVIGRN